MLGDFFEDFVREGDSLFRGVGGGGGGEEFVEEVEVGFVDDLVGWVGLESIAHGSLGKGGGAGGGGIWWVWTVYVPPPPHPRIHHNHTLPRRIPPQTPHRTHPH